MKLHLVIAATAALALSACTGKASEETPANAEADTTAAVNETVSNEADAANAVATGNAAEAAADEKSTAGAGGNATEESADDQKSGTGTGGK